MKRLNRKTFLTIFLLITFFLLIGTLLYNFQIYKREYESVKRNLGSINKMLPDNMITHKPKEFDNMIIMDYEVYTVYINNNSIDRIINHSNNNSSFDINNIAYKLLNKENKYYIGNLYLNKYSYNKTDNVIIIVNTKNINSKLTTTLFISLILFMIMEILVYIVSRLITKWITKPAIESLKKQKEFVADASHELKTPLAIIMASTDEIIVNNDNKKYIENIKYESDRMNNLIKNMLELSKLENGISKKMYKDENISKIILKISATFESIAFEKEVNIITDIEDNIYFSCIKEDIEKLLSIIIDNAIKHSYKKTNIIIKLYMKKNFINIEIINIGPGIKKGEEEKIFERFYQSDKARTSDNRYGLGLAIAKNIVTNYNGIIKAYNKDNNTVFKIQLKK